MDIDVLLNEWKSFNLRDDEKEAHICLNSEETININDPVEKYLVGKLLTNRNISKIAIKNVFKGAWKTRKEFSVEIIEKNIFLFKFESQEDRE